MTEQFIRRCGLNESVATSKSFYCIDIIESAYDAISEGVSPFEVIQTSGSYTGSLIFDLLDNIKEMLLKLCQQIFSALNNLYVNNIRLLDKYYEVVMSNLSKMTIPITHETYEYPDVGVYPATVKITTVDTNIRALENKIQDPKSTINPMQAAGEVDHILREFSAMVIGKPVDVYCLKSSTEAIVTKKVRGKKIVERIDRDTLRDYKKSIDTYKKDKDELNRTKKTIIEDYEALRASYEKWTADPMKLAKNSIRVTSNPDKEAFLSQEYRRYADIHVEMLRLFNGFITIYQAAFDRRLKLLEEKIEDRRNTIVQIFMSTGVFAAVNTKDAGRPGEKPIPYMPRKPYGGEG